MALNQLQTKRRVILSGTPVQNDLTEYFSLLNFVNPGVLGNANEFRRKYEIPIMKARDSLATEKETTDGLARLQEVLFFFFFLFSFGFYCSHFFLSFSPQLLSMANKFTIRRTNAILAMYLPVKGERAFLSFYFMVKNNKPFFCAVEQVVFCRMSDVQKTLYKNFLSSKSATKAANGGSSLMGITTLKKLANRKNIFVFAFVLSCVLFFLCPLHHFPL